MGLRIEVAVNGEKREIPAGLNVRQMLLHLGLDPQRVAVELNRAIVGKAVWDATSVEPDANIEIVEFVGGGSRQ
jgi:thiamine biosynthesis protein ThiS